MSRQFSIRLDMDFLIQASHRKSLILKMMEIL